MAKATSKAVKQSEDRRGIKSTSVKLDPDEMALWDRMRELHGGKKEALVIALRKLENSEITKDEVLAWIKANA